jgi:hypothetical protein
MLFQNDFLTFPDSQKQDRCFILKEVLNKRSNLKYLE